jgi:hypothetical protein
LDSSGKTPDKLLGGGGSQREGCCCSVGMQHAHWMLQGVRNKEKGGEQNEKESITSNQPGVVVHVILGCARG